MTEQTPLEHMARALAYEIAAGEYPLPGKQVCIEGGFVGQETFKEIAAIMLKAIKEPSKAMIAAGKAAMGDGADDPTEGDAWNCFEAMIDTALGEGE